MGLFPIQPKIDLCRRPWKVSAIVLILGVCGFLLHQAWGPFLAAWMTRSGVADPALYEQAIRYDADNADYRFALAQIYNYSAAHLDIEKAKGQYRAAARLNPRRSAHWLELSKLYEQEGDADGARRAMEKALETDPNFAQTHWSAANLYVRLGDLEAADYQMRRAADLDVSYLTQVLELVWRFYADPEFIMETHVPNSRDAGLVALDYFVGQDSEVGSELAWARLKRFRTEPVERLPYVDYLLGKDRSHDAHAVFSHGLGEEVVAGVFNGGFESEPMNRGFDWRVSSSANEIARRVTSDSRMGLRSLRIEFGGEANVDYGRVTHALAVDPGRAYELKFWMRTEDLSTDQGVYVEIDGERSEARLGTTFWEEFTIPFRASSQLVTIRVRRDPSGRLNNRIAGTVWLDEFSLDAME